jgi:oligopeptide transport system permease protein
MTETQYFDYKDVFTEAEKRRAAHSLWYYSWMRFRRNRLAMAGLVTIIILFLIAITAGVISPFDPVDQTLEYATKHPGFTGDVLVKNAGSEDDFIPIQRVLRETTDSVYYIGFTGNEESIAKGELSGDSESDWHRYPRYLLGTDRYGRDILSRLIYGSRVSLSVGIISESISIFIGVVLGALAGFFRGKTDSVVMWLVNVTFAFPSILVILALSVVLGTGSHLWLSELPAGLILQE